MADDIMLRTTSRVEQLTLEDKAVTECKIIEKSIVVTGRQERLTGEVNVRLTEDLIDEIFARLPIKSLIQFRSLSKSWYCRIASPAFIRMVTTVRSMNTPKKVLIQHVANGGTCKVTFRDIREYIYTLHSEDKLPVCPIRGYTDVTPVQCLFPFSRIDIIGSCYGIICLYKKEPGFILWNFSVRCKVTIRDHPFMRANEKDCQASLGFGFDPIANDYNIVGILFDGAVHTSFIYSLKTNSWSEIDSPTRPIYYVFPRAILFNGALHWVATETSNIRERIMILTFNLSSHVFGTISLPEPSRRSRARELTIVNGCLGLISRENFTTWVWVMREYDNVASWSLVHELDMTRFNRVRVIKALSNGGLLFGISKYSNYTIYYPDTRVLSELLNYKGTSRIVDMEMYVESLELLDKGTPCGNTISWEKERSKEKVSS